MEDVDTNTQLQNTTTANELTHMLRPIPQTYIDRPDPKAPIEEEQNIGYY
jgi:hypothetical protein